MNDDVSAAQSATVYEVVGGMDFFLALVDRFYDRVDLDPVLRPLYPEDLAESRRHTALFLGQYWGGPTTYSNERGHPRLRMRHAPFVIGQRERDAWLGHMLAALSEVDVHPEARKMMSNYFEQASTAMMNST